MAQIVSFAVNEQGNYVLEIKRAKQPLPRVRTTQVAGTNWDEPLNGLYGKDPEGRDVPLLASVTIRYPNRYNVDLAGGKKAGKPELVIPKASGDDRSNLLPFKEVHTEQPPEPKKNGTNRLPFRG